MNQMNAKLTKINNDDLAAKGNLYSMCQPEIVPFGKNGTLLLSCQLILIFHDKVRRIDIDSNVLCVMNNFNDPKNFMHSSSTDPQTKLIVLIVK